MAKINIENLDSSSSAKKIALELFKKASEGEAVCICDDSVVTVHMFDGLHLSFYSYIVRKEMSFRHLNIDDAKFGSHSVAFFNVDSECGTVMSFCLDFLSSEKYVIKKRE